jgi:hypothetical protein
MGAMNKAAIEQIDELIHRYSGEATTLRDEITRAVVRMDEMQKRRGVFEVLVLRLQDLRETMTEEQEPPCE